MPPKKRASESPSLITHKELETMTRKEFDAWFDATLKKQLKKDTEVLRAMQ